jgi:hypothetical protein
MYKSPANFFFENVLENLEIQENDIINFLFNGDEKKYEEFRNNNIVLDDKLSYNLYLITSINPSRWLNLQNRYLNKIKNDL